VSARQPSALRRRVGCVNPVLVREPGVFQAKAASGIAPARGARLEKFLHRVIHKEPLGEARARARSTRTREGRTRLVSRALRSAAEEPDQLVALALSQSGDRL
jgi:hypothetical protein